MPPVACLAAEPFAGLVEALVEQGWWSGRVIDPDQASAWRRAAVSLLRRQGHSAGIGRLHAHQVDSRIRGDRIAWLEPACAGPLATWLETLEGLRERLRSALRLPLAEVEAMVARYARGARYAPHRDQHRGVAGRLLSTVLYLNPDWQDGAGGELRLWPDEEDRHRTVLIPPRGGVLVVFRAELLHEVLPSRGSRYSLTAWLRRPG